MNKKANWAFGLSVVAVILCIVSVCIAAYRTPELGFDYQGVIVGVLSLLVTVLVGLNIYTLVDFKKKEELIDKKVASIADALLSLNKSKLTNEAATEHVISFLYYSLMGLKDPLGLEYRYLYHNILSLEKLSMLDEIETCNAIVKGILDVIAIPEKVSMSQKNKELLYGLVCRIKKPERIKGLGSLILTTAIIYNIINYILHKKYLHRICVKRIFSLHLFTQKYCISYVFQNSRNKIYP